MSLAVASLASADPAVLELAKLGVLGASPSAGAVGFASWRGMKRGPWTGDR